MAPGPRPQQRLRRPRSALLPRLAACGATAAGLALVARSGAFVGFPSGPVAAPRVRALATEKGGGGGPVVDDSDFDLEDDNKKGQEQKAKAAQLDAILEAADNIASQKDKIQQKKKATSSLASLEEELAGKTIEDDVDLSVGMMKAARSGRVDTSLEGRIAKWFYESKELIQNPTKLQLTYLSIFFGSVSTIFWATVCVIALGALKYKGEGIGPQEAWWMQNSPTTRWAALREANKEYMKSMPLGTNIKEVDPVKFGNGQWGLAKSLKPVGEKQWWELEQEKEKISDDKTTTGRTQESLDLAADVAKPQATYEFTERIGTDYQEKRATGNWK